MSEPPAQNWRDEITVSANSSVTEDISQPCRRAYSAASPAIARAMCVVMRGNWNSRESFRPRMPVYFRRVQENHVLKSDRMLNIFTKAMTNNRKPIKFRALAQKNKLKILQSKDATSICRCRHDHDMTSFDSRILS
jgi:hypothetical protein